jgi:hypothetical protein
MFLQWCIYRRQTREMRRQRHEMRGQRHIMYRQWKAMRGQLAQMEASGRQTDKLIEQAEKSADAANTSADAAKLNSQAVINSERPLLLVEFKKYSHPTVKGHSLFKIFAVNYGRTPARILSCSTPTEQACIFPYKELELPYPSRISELWTHKVMPPKESLEITTFYPTFGHQQTETDRSCRRRRNSSCGVSYRYLWERQILRNWGGRSKPLLDSILLPLQHRGFFRYWRRPRPGWATRVQRSNLAVGEHSSTGECVMGCGNSI